MHRHTRREEFVSLPAGEAERVFRLRAWRQSAALGERDEVRLDATEEVARIDMQHTHYHTSRTYDIRFTGGGSDELIQDLQPCVPRLPIEGKAYPE